MSTIWSCDLTFHLPLIYLVFVNWDNEWKIFSDLNCCHDLCLLTTFIIIYRTVTTWYSDSKRISPERRAGMHVKSIHNKRRSVVTSSSYLCWRRKAEHGWTLLSPMSGSVFIETTGKYVTPIRAFFKIPVTSSKAPTFYLTPLVSSKLLANVPLSIFWV